MSFLSGKRKQETAPPLPEEAVEEMALESAEAADELKPEDVEPPKKAGRVKKKYMYAACDRSGRPLWDEQDKLYCQSVTGEDLPLPQSWPNEIRGMAHASRKLRVEIEFDDQVKDQKDGRKKAKEQAREKLTRLAREQMGYADGAAPSVQEEQVREEQASPELKPEIVPEAEEPLGDAGAERVPEVDTQPKKPRRVEDAVSADDWKAAQRKFEQMARSLDEDRRDVEDLMDLIQAESKAIRKLTETRSKGLEDQVRKYAENTTRAVTDKVRSSTKDVAGQMDSMARDLEEKQDQILSKAGSMKMQINELAESVESMEGNLSRLKQLDKISELLQNKGMVITMDIPPVNADEEDIVNLVRYSQKITEQLGYAARELLRKRDAFKSREQSTANEQMAMEKRMTDMRAEGFRKGRLDVVKRLISKYEDVHTIRMSENDHVHVIWTFLTEMGVEIDGEGRFEKGQEVQIGEEEAQKMLAVYSKIDGAGKYKVTRTGLVFGQEILLKAEFERVPDQPEEPADGAPGQDSTG